MGLVPHPRAIAHLDPLELEINYNYSYSSLLKVCYLPHAGFFLGLFFELEDGGIMFLQNVS
jgi:hypothetical protein